MLFSDKFIPVSTGAPPAGMRTAGQGRLSSRHKVNEPSMGWAGRSNSRRATGRKAQVLRLRSRRRSPGTKIRLVAIRRTANAAIHTAGFFPGRTASPAPLYSSPLDSARAQKCGGVHRAMIPKRRIGVIEKCPVTASQPISGGTAPIPLDRTVPAPPLGFSQSVYTSA